MDACHWKLSDSIRSLDCHNPHPICPIHFEPMQSLSHVPETRAEPLSNSENIETSSAGFPASTPLWLKEQTLPAARYHYRCILPSSEPEACRNKWMSASCIPVTFDLLRNLARSRLLSMQKLYRSSLLVSSYYTCGWGQSVCLLDHFKVAILFLETKLANTSFILCYLKLIGSVRDRYLKFTDFPNASKPRETL